METYTLLRTVPVFADVRRRVRRRYHSLKHIHRLLRFCLQLVELFFQLVLLFSWPVIILCYYPIIITDRVLCDSLEFLIRYCPAIMRPAPQVYASVTHFVLSFTIGKVVVFFILIFWYIIYFIFHCLWMVIDLLIFIVSLFREEEAGTEVHAASHPPALQQEPAWPRVQPGPASGDAHRHHPRVPPGLIPRRRGSRSRVGVNPRRGPWSSARGAASPSSSSKTSEDGGADGAAAAVRRPVVYRLRLRRRPRPSQPAAAPAGPQPARPVWTKSAEAVSSTATAASSETCSVASKAESQYDVTDAQRIMVSAILDPVPQDLETILNNSGRDDIWHDASEHTEAETNRVGSVSPQSMVETEVTGTRDTEAARQEYGTASLRVVIPRLASPRTSGSPRLEHLQMGDAAAAAAHGPSAPASRPGITRSRSFIPRLSAHVAISSQRSSGSSND